MIELLGLLGLTFFVYMVVKVYEKEGFGSAIWYAFVCLLIGTAINSALSFGMKLLWN
jgi:hypothetical protein